MKKLINFSADLYRRILERMEPGETVTGFVRAAVKHEIEQRDEHEKGFDRHDLEMRIAAIEARMEDGK